MDVHIPAARYIQHGACPVRTRQTRAARDFDGERESGFRSGQVRSGGLGRVGLAETGAGCVPGQEGDECRAPGGFAGDDLPAVGMSLLMGGWTGRGEVAGWSQVSSTAAKRVATEVPGGLYGTLLGVASGWWFERGGAPTHHAPRTRGPGLSSPGLSGPCRRLSVLPGLSRAPQLLLGGGEMGRAGLLTVRAWALVCARRLLALPCPCRMSGPHIITVSWPAALHRHWH